ncbi:Enriched in surface-labeled proteome protein 18 [Trypanosoma cruzi]|nr:Enriched in surface-labeled proteome protein 18 [Trypanosoma cruzi]
MEFSLYLFLFFCSSPITHPGQNNNKKKKENNYLYLALMLGMRGVCTVWIFVCVVLMFGLSLSHAELSTTENQFQELSPPQTSSEVSETNSLTFPFFACEAELRQFCPKQMEAPLKCLLQHFESQRNTKLPWRRRITFSSACSRWLWARQECVSYVRQTGICRASESARNCLRRIPPRGIPSGCRDTEYYRSVLLYGEMKRKQGLWKPSNTPKKQQKD